MAQTTITEDSESAAAPSAPSNKRWYVVHAYSGMEKSVKKALVERVARSGMEDQFGQILVPTEEVVEVKNGQKSVTERRFFPGYVLVEMEMTDESWHLVKNTAKVTGFVGGKANRPTPISQKEVEKIMAQMQEGLGGRIPLFKPNALSPAQKKTYDMIDTKMVPWAEKSGFKAKNDDGTLIGPFNGILLSPEITDAFLALQATEQDHTTLSQRVRQVVILTVGAVWQCDYERYAHAAVAEKAGLPDPAIRSLSNGEPATELAADEQLAQRFARQVAAERQVDDDLYAQVEATFGAQGIVDLLYLAGCYETIASLLNTFKVPAPAR